MIRLDQRKFLTAIGKKHQPILSPPVYEKQAHSIETRPQRAPFCLPRPCLYHHITDVSIHENRCIG